MNAVMLHQPMSDEKRAAEIARGTCGLKFLFHKYVSLQRTFNAFLSILKQLLTRARPCADCIVLSPSDNAEYAIK